MDNTAPHRPWVTCPGCSEPFDPDAEAPDKLDDGSISCPFCSTRFIPAPALMPDQEGDFIIEDDSPPPAEEPATPDEKEISRNKVRQLSALRRGAYRTRSYCTVVTVFLLVAAAKLTVLTVHRVKSEGWQPRAMAYTCFAIAAVMIAVYFARRVIDLTRELRRPVLNDPETPPDFSTLSDGSQYWKRLEEL